MHAAKLFKHKITAKGDIDQDSLYKQAETRFLAHYQQSFALLESLEQYQEVVKRFGSVTGLLGDRLSAYYTLGTPERPPKIADYIASSTASAAAKLSNAAEGDVAANVRAWAEYCGFLRNLHAKIQERRTALEEYDYYRNKVKELKERPRDDGQLARNEGKLFSSQEVYEALNTELIEVFTSLSDSASTSFNPRFAAFANASLEVTNSLDALNGDVQRAMASPAAYGIADTQVIYKPLVDKYGTLPAHEDRKTSVLGSIGLGSLLGSDDSKKAPQAASTSSSYGPVSSGTGRPSNSGRTANTASDLVDYDDRAKTSAATSAQATSGGAGGLRAGRRARALYDFDAQAADELKLTQGDVVLLIQEAEEGWWKAEVNGKQGVVPYNYLDPL